MSPFEEKTSLSRSKTWALSSGLVVYRYLEFVSFLYHRTLRDNDGSMLYGTLASCL